MLPILIALWTFGIAHAHQAPNCLHNVEKISDYGSMLELDDGSKWKVGETDVYKVVMSWKKNDKVAIHPNTNWFSSCAYYLTNAEGSYVQADLFSPPARRGPKTQWVQALNKFSGHLFLNDGSSWKIAVDDWLLFEKWKNDDSIIIGICKSWFSAYEYVLINVEMNCYVRATPF